MIIHAISSSTIMSSCIFDSASSNTTVNDSNEGLIICSVKSHEMAKCSCFVQQTVQSLNLPLIVKTEYNNKLQVFVQKARQQQETVLH